MQWTTIPQTTLLVPRIGFGTASLHHLLKSAQRQHLLRAAWDAGITHFDTARMYGHGMAERELGTFLLGRRNQATIATKFGIPASRLLEAFPSFMYSQKLIEKLRRQVLGKKPSGNDYRYFCKIDAEKSLSKSLRSLQTDWIDILFVHEPSLRDVGRIDELSEWLGLVKRKGTVRYLGLAGNSTNCAEIKAKTGKLFDILQIEDSIDLNEADSLSKFAFPMQITYGYWRRSLERSNTIDSAMILKQALKRNQHGMVLVSTRKPQRVIAFAQQLEQVA